MQIQKIKRMLVNLGLITMMSIIIVTTSWAQAATNLSAISPMDIAIQSSTQSARHSPMHSSITWSVPLSHRPSPISLNQRPNQRNIPLLPGIAVPGVGILQPLPSAPGCLFIQPNPNRISPSVSAMLAKLRPSLQTLLFANPSSACPISSNQPPLFDTDGVLRIPSYQVFDQIIPAYNPERKVGGFLAVQSSTRDNCWFGTDAAETVSCKHPLTAPPSQCGLVDRSGSASNRQISPSVLYLKP
jgi:hypothetical protein